MNIRGDMSNFREEMERFQKLMAKDPELRKAVDGMPKQIQKAIDEELLKEIIKDE